jgi:hypothetical protein
MTVVRNWRRISRSGLAYIRLSCVSDSPNNHDTSQSASNPDIRRIARILKHLAAMGYIKETGVDEYQPTNFAKALTIPIIGDAYLVM